MFSVLLLCETAFQYGFHIDLEYGFHIDSFHFPDTVLFLHTRTHLATVSFPRRPSDSRTEPAVDSFSLPLSVFLVFKKVVRRHDI